MTVIRISNLKMYTTGPDQLQQVHVLDVHVM